MKRKMKEQESWTERLRSHQVNCALALVYLEELAQKCQNDKDVQPLLQRVKKAMEQIQMEADRLHEEMCLVPVRTMFSMDRLKLSKQQYWLLRAAGVEIFTAKRLGICPVDDYDVYRNCIYEDDKRVFFVDPNETPNMETPDKEARVIRVRARIACSPEETALQHYRPEQKRFFSKYRPDVLARARKTEKKRSTCAKVTSTS